MSELNNFDSIKNGAIKTQSAYAHKQPEIKITKGFTAKKIDDPSKISKSNVTLVEHNTGAGSNIKFTKGAWASSARMVITGCRKSDNEKE